MALFNALLKVLLNVKKIYSTLALEGAGLERNRVQAAAKRCQSEAVAVLSSAVGGSAVDDSAVGGSSAAKGAPLKKRVGIA